MFYHSIQTVHSIWAAIALLMLTIAVVNSVSAKFSKRSFTLKDRKIALWGLIAIHLQVTLGLILYFVSPLGLDVLGQMSSATLRLTSLEHPLVALIAVGLITVGWSKHKKSEEPLKHHNIALFYTIAWVLILSRIPWSLWF